MDKNEIDEYRKRKASFKVNPLRISLSVPVKNWINDKEVQSNYGEPVYENIDSFIGLPKTGLQQIIYEI